jgi:hypothetical protein
MRATSLNSIEKIAKEMSRIYNQYKRGDIKDTKYRSSVYGLSKLSECLKDSLLEARLISIEESLKKRQK